MSIITANSEYYAGSVELAGSKDRWVAAVGIGGHKEYLPGAYQTAGEARAAVFAELGRRQTELRAQTVGHDLRIAPIRIDVVGDAEFTAPTLSNRKARRAAGRPTELTAVHVTRLYLDDETRAIFADLGDGNMSEGARIAAQQAKSPPG